MHFAKSIQIFLSAALAAAGIAVPATEGPLRSVALAAGTCGGNNQRACTVFERPGNPCNSGLVEVSKNLLDPKAGRCVRKSAARANCGRQGQRACTILERSGRPCDAGLVERTSNYLDPRAGRCERFDPNNPGTIIDNVRDVGNVVVAVSSDSVTQVPAIINMSSRDAARLAPLSADMLALWASCATRFDRLKSFTGQPFLDAIESTSCLEDTLDLASRHGYKTVTVGMGASLSVGLGVEAEAGFAFDVDRVNNATVYQSQGFKVNSAGVGGALTIGLWRARNDQLAGDGQGIVGGIKAFGGSGGGLWYDYDQNFAGFSVSLTAGAGYDAAYVRNQTRADPTNILPYRRRSPAPAPSMAGGGNTGEYFPDRAPLDRGRMEPLLPTSLSICNRSGEDVIDTALAYWNPAARDGEGGWRSQGWYAVDGDRCITVELPSDESGGPYSGEVFMIGSADAMEWEGGPERFCVGSRTRFTYEDSDAADCPSPDARKGSQRIYVEAGKTNRYDFEPGERINDLSVLKICNETHVRTIEFAIARDRGARLGNIVSQGWWPVARGECHSLVVGGVGALPMDGDVFVTARSDRGDFGGNDGSFCFDPEFRGTIREADTANCAAANRRSTVRVEVRPGRVAQYTFDD